MKKQPSRKTTSVSFVSNYFKFAKQPISRKREVVCCVCALSVLHDTEAHFIQTTLDVLYNVGDSRSLISDALDVPLSSEIDLEGLCVLWSVTILSVVLENTSEHMASNSVLQSLASHILLAMTSSNTTVRE
eukprot:10707882-Ditylum_brightwellii.AAC.1